MYALNMYSKKLSTLAPMFVCGLIHEPEKMSIIVPTTWCAARRRHKLRKARRAAFRYLQSPVSCVSSPNSSRREPAAAGHDVCPSALLTPARRWISLNGMAVGVLNAGISLSAICTASGSREPSYANASSRSGRSDVARRRGPCFSASRCAESNPPTTRIVVSNTDTLRSASKRTLLPTSRTRLKNSTSSPTSASMSSESIKVIEYPPKTFVPVHVTGCSSSCGYAYVMYEP
mmetsp:Transcript_43027/g.132981  ORF Transcript_43027/g.132981 Transcript_43027/m.132981 type:complete len:232 (+) Transcript_43027:3095-3790(+)